MFPQHVAGTSGQNSEGAAPKELAEEATSQGWLHPGELLLQQPIEAKGQE